VGETHSEVKREEMLADPAVRAEEGGSGKVTYIVDGRAKSPWPWILLGVAVGIALGAIMTMILLPINVSAPISELSRNPVLLDSAHIDKPVPQFDLPPLYEDKSGLSSDNLSKGRVSLVNIFASWCVPCRVERPVLMELADSGTPVHGITYKDEPPESRRFLRSLGNPYSRIGVDEVGRTATEFGVSGVPETFIISGDGRIVYQQIGPITDANRDDLMAAIEKARAGAGETGG